VKEKFGVRREVAPEVLNGKGKMVRVLTEKDGLGKAGIFGKIGEGKGERQTYSRRPAVSL